MISITQHIEFLMLRNDCVIIPGWGAFVASYNTASINGNRIARPTREIGFNPSITHNDGLLANSIARRHGISFDTACRQIENAVDTYKLQLRAGSDIPFGYLGYMTMTGGRGLEFLPLRENVMIDEFFGLKSFALAQQSRQTAPGTVTGTEFFRRKSVKIAASIAAIVCMGALLSTPIIDKQTQTASMNVAQIKPAAHQATAAQPSSNIVIDNSEKQIKVVDEKTSESKQENSLEMPCEEEGRYLLAIDECSSAKKAEKTVRRSARKGVDARIVTQGDEYLVVVAQSSDKKELERARKRLPRKYRHASISELEQ